MPTNGPPETNTRLAFLLRTRPKTNIKMSGLMFLLFCTCLVQASLCLSVEEQHLIRCLTNISERYFAHGRTVLLSMPLVENTEFKTELVMQLHQADKWSIFIHQSGDFEDLDKSKIIHPQGSLLLFVNYSCTNDVRWKQTFLEQILLLILPITENRYHPAWGTEAVFVFVLTIECSIDKDFAALGFYFHNFFVYKFMRAVIILQRFQSTTKHGAARYNRFEVFANFPYQSSVLCREFTLRDTWIMEGDGYFKYISNLFPEISYKNLHGCPIRAVFKAHYTAKPVLNETNHLVDVRGQEGTIFKLLMEAMNGTAQYQYTTSKDDGVMTRILFKDKTADIAFGGVGEEYMQKTIRYHWRSLRWYVPCDVKSARIERVFKILSVSLWIVSVITLLLVAIVVVYLAGTAEWQTYKSVGSCLMEMLAAIVAVSVSAMPRTPAVRVLFLSWVLFSFSYNTVFLSYLTTYMIEPGYDPQIEDMDQLIDSDLALVTNVPRKWQDAYSKVIEIRKVVCSLQNAATWASRYRNCSVLASPYMIKLMYLVGFLRDEFKLCTLNDGIESTFGTGMMLLPRNPLYHQVNDILTRLVEGGITNLLFDRQWDYWKLEYKPSGKPRELDNYYAFNLDNLFPPFILLLSGLSLSVLGVLLELLVHRYHQNVATALEKLRLLFCNRRTFIRIWDRSRELLSSTFKKGLQVCRNRVGCAVCKKCGRTNSSS